MWLHQVLVAAWRIFDLHCDMQDLFILGWELLVAGWIQFHVLYSVMCTWFFKFILLKYSWFYNILISAVQQSDSVIHRYTFFFIFFSIMVYPRILNIAPCAIQEDLVVYPISIYKSLPLLIPNSWSIPSPPSIPPGTHKSVFYYLWVFFIFL